eukprot:2247179-Prymnesium_polylepis.1
MFTDSVISRFGRGLKHAAFFLGMLLKIVTTVPDNPKVFETTMDIKEMRRKYKTNRASSWEFEKQSRDPGDPLRKGQTSDAERASDWAKKRLADEPDTMGKKKSGTTIMVFDVRSKEVRADPSCTVSPPGHT